MEVRSNLKELSGSGEPNIVNDGEGTMEGILYDGIVSKEGIPV